MSTESLQYIEDALEGENKLGQMFNEFYGKWRGFIEELDSSKASLNFLLKSMKNQSLSVDAQKKRVIDDVENFRSEILLVAQDDNDAEFQEDEIDDEAEVNVEYSADFEVRDDPASSSMTVNYDVDGDSSTGIRDKKKQEEQHLSLKRGNDEEAMTHYYGNYGANS